MVITFMSAKMLVINIVLCGLLSTFVLGTTEMSTKRNSAYSFSEGADSYEMESLFNSRTIHQFPDSQASMPNVFNSILMRDIKQLQTSLFAMSNIYEQESKKLEIIHKEFGISQLIEDFPSYFQYVGTNQSDTHVSIIIKITTFVGVSTSPIKVVVGKTSVTLRLSVYYSIPYPSALYPNRVYKGLIKGFQKLYVNKSVDVRSAVVKFKRKENVVVLTFKKKVDSMLAGGFLRYGSYSVQQQSLLMDNPEDI